MKGIIKKIKKFAVILDRQIKSIIIENKPMHVDEQIELLSLQEEVYERLTRMADILFMLDYYNKEKNEI